MQEKLLKHKNATITLAELEGFAYKEQSYEQFAQDVLALVSQKMLQPMKNTGQTFRKPSLHYKYKILKHTVKQNLRETIERLQLRLDSRISLDAYYRFSSEQLQQDLPFIEKINQFLRTYERPLKPAPAPERSQALVGDEKWIQYKGGKSVLDRIGLLQEMQIVDVKEPLRFALNPANLQEVVQYHLIVENKTTYEGLLPVLTETRFSTLIYGAGFEIVSSLSLFEKQFPLPNVRHVFYYFGDVDFTGISIWYLLQKQQEIILAHAFYDAALQDKGKSIPKKQLKDEEAIAAFLHRLKEPNRTQCQTLVNKKYYVSQEVLTATKLQEVWQQLSRTLC